MEHHNLFHVLAAIIIVGAIMIASTAGWMKSIPFFIFAAATAMRGASLKRGHPAAKNAAYVFFLIGIVWLIWTFFS